MTTRPKKWRIALREAIDQEQPLQPEEFRTASATTPIGAICAMLRERAKKQPGFPKPAIAYVALGTECHENGLPVVIQSFTMTWGKPA